MGWGGGGFSFLSLASDGARRGPTVRKVLRFGRNRNIKPPIWTDYTTPGAAIITTTHSTTIPAIFIIIIIITEIKIALSFCSPGPATPRTSPFFLLLIYSPACG